MNPMKIEYGQRYLDGSGWMRLLSVDEHNDRVEISLQGTDARFSLEDFWWVVRAAMEARERLGMDKLIVEGPQPGSATGERDA